MALRTDDCDIYDNHLMVTLGGNGDYYVTILDQKDGTFKSVRVSTSGGFAPTDVKIAVAELYRAMEREGLNEWPD